MGYTDIDENWDEFDADFYDISQEYMPYMFLEEDEITPFNNEINKDKARKRRKNARKEQKKYKAQYKIGANRWLIASPAYGMDKNGNYTDDPEEIAYYKKTYEIKPTDRFRFFKKLSNKKLRKMPEDMSLRGNKYRKFYNIWNEIY